MINGKRIEMVAVMVGDTIMMCIAPYMTYLTTGDQVVIEGIDSFGTVLIRDNVVLGDNEYTAIEEVCSLHRIVRRVDFSEMNWSGYEEGTDADGQES